MLDHHARGEPEAQARGGVMGGKCRVGERVEGLELGLALRLGLRLRLRQGLRLGSWRLLLDLALAAAGST